MGEQVVTLNDYEHYIRESQIIICIAQYVKKNKYNLDADTILAMCGYEENKCTEV